MLRALIAAALTLAALAAPLLGVQAGGLAAAAGAEAGGDCAADACCCEEMGMPAHGDAAPAPARGCGSMGTMLIAGCRCGHHPPDVSHHETPEPRVSQADGAELPALAAGRSCDTLSHATPAGLRHTPDPPPPRALS